MLRGGDIRVAGAMEGGHQEVARRAGAVAGEHSPRAIGAVCRGGEAEDQNARPWIAKAWNGLSPVGVEAVGRLLVTRDLAAVRAQPRAPLAADDRLCHAREWTARVDHLRA